MIRVKSVLSRGGYRGETLTTAGILIIPASLELAAALMALAVCSSLVDILDLMTSL